MRSIHPERTVQVAAMQLGQQFLSTFNTAMSANSREQLHDRRQLLRARCRINHW